MTENEAAGFNEFYDILIFKTSYLSGFKMYLESHDLIPSRLCAGAPLADTYLYVCDWSSLIFFASNHFIEMLVMK